MVNKNININTIPWIEKYRPYNLDEIVSHDHIINVLKKFITNKTLPHLLFQGPPGAGKTSTIMACARELYKDKYNLMVKELNASDDRGIEVVRNGIKKFVRSRSVFFDTNNKDNEMFKLVILDEADAMTVDAQSNLKRVIERYTLNARFCLICNYVNKIDPALRSRCTSFIFTPLKSKDIKKRIKKIIEKERINVSENALDTIIKWSNGDMRKILNILQVTSMAYKKVNRKTVNKCIGYPSISNIKHILKYVFKYPYNKAYNMVHAIVKKNTLSLIDIISEFHNIILLHMIGEKKNKYLKKYDIVHISKLLCLLRDVESIQLKVLTSNIQLGQFVGIFKLMNT